MQVNKSLLKKCLAAICCICLTLACVFGVAACGGDTTVKDVKAANNRITVELTDGTKHEYDLDGVVKTEEKDGVIKVTYADGHTEELRTNGVSAVKTTIKDGKTYIVLTMADGTTKEVALEKVVQSVKKSGNGAIEVTYTDGSKETLSYDESCEHEFGTAAVVRPASCIAEGVAVKVCKKCGLVESEELVKDAKVHGTWEFDATVTKGKYERTEVDGIVTLKRADEGKTHYVLNTNYAADTMTALEEKSGVATTCFKAVCKDCGEEFSSGHKSVDKWISVPLNDKSITVCENEHPSVKTCPDCKAVFLYTDGSFGPKESESGEMNELDVTITPAKGHTYEMNGTPEKITDKTYQLTLICTTCGKTINPKASFVSEVAATCREGGYKTFAYSYENIKDGEKITVNAEIQLEKTDKTFDHTVGTKEDGKLLQYRALDLNTSESKEYEFTPEVKPFVDNKTIQWSEGIPATCKNHMPAVFTCTVCEEKIVIALSGEHTYGAEKVVDATCTTDGYSYRECTVCGDIYKYNEVKAKGHVYSYVNDSFDASAKTAKFRCACGDIQTKPVTVDETYESTDCKSKSYKKYKATLDNGIGGKQEIVFKIEDKDQILWHTVKEGVRTYRAYVLNNKDTEYEYNDTFRQLFKEGLIRWSEGIPSKCSEHMPAVFTCTKCNEQIVIVVSGEHMNLDESDKQVVEATCTTHGSVSVKCKDCGKYVEQSVTNAKGHSFAPVAAEWNAFIASPADKKEVTFKCADCTETIKLVAKKTALPETSDKCGTTQIDKYDFVDKTTGKSYTYKVEAAEYTDTNKQYITKTFEYSWTKTNSSSKHTIGTYNNTTVKEVAFNIKAPDANKVPWSPAIAYFFSEEGGKVLRWNEGVPGTCSQYALAVFKCTVCNEQIVILVSGEHHFDVTKQVAADVVSESVNEVDRGDSSIANAAAAEPTCTKGTRTWMHCPDCGKWIEDKTAARPALGHDIPTDGWKVKTAEGTEFKAKAWYDTVEKKVKLDKNELNVGYAEGVCKRCGETFKVDKEKAAGMTGWKITQQQLPNCSTAGSIVVEYWYAINGVSTKVAEKTIAVPVLNEHITSFTDATKYVKGYDKDNNQFFIAYYCEGCSSFIIYKKGTEAEINKIIKEQLKVNPDTVQK